MKISTTETIPGYEIIDTIDIARGNAVRTKHLGVDFMAGLKNITGGEITGYTKLQAEAREQAIGRMIADAETLEADAIVCVRLTTAMITRGASEMVAYGTAVKIKKNS